MKLERSLGPDDREAHAKGVADFHRILLERCGNVALGVVGQALHDVVERHMALAYRTERPISPTQREKQRAFGLKSQERLIDLIDAKDGAEAEAHWKRHMAAAGNYWLEGIRGASVIDLLE